jgi:catechol 2,3-dioxygenase-like lactoylglutathione lyase family enzyme
MPAEGPVSGGAAGVSTERPPVAGVSTERPPVPAPTDAVAGETLAFDHVNLRTADLAGMTAWYAEALGLTPGWRPDFPFPGAWLYAGDRALVHLVAVERSPGADPDDLRLEHFALRGRDMDAFLARMERLGVSVRLGRPPRAGLTQVNIVDPDGNHIHVDFADP